jgi:hypothetical protein
MIYLADLPYDHKNRNMELEGCWYQSKQGGMWKQIVKSFKISSKSYNDLGSAWTDFDNFTFDKENGESI